MKNLFVPALLGACFLAAPSLPQADAQMPFTGAPAPYGHSNGFGQPAVSAAPAVAPATAVPGGAYGVPVNGYPVMAASSEQIDPDHKLNRGDRLSYRVIEDRDPTVIPLIVTDSGEVDVPLINRVKAVGKTTQQLTSDIKSRLEQEYYYHATVVLGLDAVAPRASKGTVYMSGAIAAGSVELPLDTNLTLSQAIQKVGGPKDFADLKRVRVLRHGGPKKGFIVNVAAVMKGDLEKDFVLQPNDQVQVPEKLFNVNF